MSTDQLLQKFKAVGEGMREASRNMGDEQRAMVATAFEDICDHVFPEGDIETDHDMMRLAASRTALRFGSQFLDAMMNHTPEEIMEAMERLDEVQP